MGVSKKVALDKDQKYTIGYSFKNKMGISANNFVLLELIKDGSIMYTRKLQATEANTFDYTAPATGEYTWRMRSSSIGTTTTQPMTYSLDNLSIFYTYPYTIENCDNLADGYRFGFNTQEKDDEIYGEGNLNTAMFWEYDTRIGRRWNVDPKTYTWESPYAVNSNNPIWIMDILGDKGNKSSEAKQKERFEKKWEEKIVTPLKTLEQSLKLQGEMTDAQIRDAVQDKADELSIKYQNTKWLHYQYRGASAKTGNESYISTATGREHKEIIRINAYSTTTTNVSVDNNRPADGSIVTSINTRIDAPPGSTVNVQFNPFAQPNSLQVLTGGSRNVVASTGGMITGPNNPVGFTYNQTVVLSTTNAGNIYYRVQNSNVSNTTDTWQLRISVTTPLTLNPKVTAENPTYDAYQLFGR
jgi:hypothetical protein